MKTNSFLFVLLISLPIFLFGQLDEKKSQYNFNFEKGIFQNGYPLGWFPFGAQDFPYDIKLDSIEKNSGQYSVCIQSTQEATKQTFGCIATTIPAIYKGDSITVKAFIKTENITEPIGLMLKIDDALSQTLQSSNMMEQKIIGSPAWKEFSVSLPLPKKAKTIIIGPLLSGTGKLWADDFSLLIDGKDFREAPLFGKPKTYKADSDTVEFKNGSGIGINKLLKQQIENLDILGKIWGMMKYYHPEIAKGNYNWDYELFRIMPGILNASSKDERNAMLTKWIKSFGEFDEVKEKNDTAIVKMEPDLKWINDKSSLGEELSIFLNKLRNAEREEENYYIDFIARGSNPSFHHENPYADMTYPDAGYRLLALFRYWNMIQYYFPYKYLIGEDWNKVLTEFIPQFVNAKNELEYQVAIAKLVARINDTHAQVFSAKGNAAIDSLTGIFHSPVDLSFVENKAMVTGFWNVKLGKESGLIEGDIVEEVNGKTVEKRMEELRPVISASNESAKLRNIVFALLRSNDTLLNIKYKRNNTLHTLKLKCYPPKMVYPNNRAEMYPGKKPYNFLSKDIGYIFMGASPGNTRTDTLRYTKGIIIDLRYSVANSIDLNFFASQQQKIVKFSHSNPLKPGEFIFDAVVEKGTENPNYYKGQVIILVNEKTQSSGEFMAMIAQAAAPNAIVMGSTTAGADGNISKIVLPGNMYTLISGIGVYYPDGRETQRIGIVPDIVVKPTVKGIQEGRDEVLEKAIEYLNAK